MTDFDPRRDHCRTFSHVWVHVRSTGDLRRAHEEMWQCEHCDTQKVSIFQADGETVWKTEYFYPESDTPVELEEIDPDRIAAMREDLQEQLDKLHREVP